MRAMPWHTFIILWVSVFLIMRIVLRYLLNYDFKFFYFVWLDIRKIWFL